MSADLSSGNQRRPERMNSIVYAAAGDAKSSSLTGFFNRPVLLEDEVMIEVHAFGLNFADILSRKGVYPDAPEYPFIPGYEVAGKILALGSRVVEQGFALNVGDKVLAFTLFGGYAQYVSTKHIGVFALPEGMSYEEGASLPVNVATAYHALFCTGMINPGDRVLIHAAAGGVGQLAVQLAKYAGCEVIGTAGSDEKLQLLKDSYKLDHGINYRKNEDVAKEIRRLCGVKSGEPCLDIILDPIGGSQLKAGIELLHPNGRMISFGVASLTERTTFAGFFSAIPNVLSMLTFNGIELLQRSKSFVGLNMLAIAKTKPVILRNALSRGLELIQQGKVKTVLSRIYDWREVPTAQLEMEERRTTGKIVFTIPWPENPEDDLFAVPVAQPVDVTQSYTPKSMRDSSSSSSSAPQ